jgi:2-(1,2-epoxy-1,2-dihydrophenyl)acetyl-CoA isomerase
MQEDACLQFSFAHIGLMPDAGATWFLPRIVGAKRALALMLTGEKIAAAQACEWGIAFRVFSADAFHAEASAFCQMLARGATQAFAETRQALQVAGADLATQLTRERDGQRRLGLTADVAEGLLAFQEKRTPRFTGN